MCFSSAHYAYALSRFYACAVSSTAICDWTQKNTKKTKPNLYLGRFLRKARVITFVAMLCCRTNRNQAKHLVLDSRMLAAYSGLSTERENNPKARPQFHLLFVFLSSFFRHRCWLALSTIYKGACQQSHKILLVGNCMSTLNWTNY